MQSIFWRSRHVCWGTYDKGRSQPKPWWYSGASYRRSHGLTSRTSSSVWKRRLRRWLLQSGEEVAVRWCQIRTRGRMGKSVPVPGVQEVRCGASDVWRSSILQGAWFYHRGFDSHLQPWWCLNGHFDCVKKFTAYVPISDPCVTCLCSK
jgi:hypothetical protein